MTQPYIDPINPYTGEVSVLAIMRNLQNGHNTFPPNMGQTIEPPSDTIGPCKLSIDPDGGLSGWTDLDKWGMWNSPIWNDTTRRARSLNLSDEERVRLLAFALLMANISLMEKFKDYVIQHP